MRKRKYNIIANRPLWFAFIGLMAGIVIAFSFAYNLLLMAVMIGVVYLTSILLLVRNNYTILMIVLISCMVGIMSFSISHAIYDSNKIDESMTYTITGRVSDTYNRDNGFDTLVLEDCKFYLGEKVAGEGRLSLFVEGNGDFTFGDILTFEAKIENENFVDFGKPSFNISNGIYYNANIKAEDIVIQDNYLKISEIVRIAVKDKTSAYFSPDESGLAYAVIFGDKQLIDDSIDTSFKYCGIAHLIAVSGVNLTILFGTLAWLMGKVGLPRVLRMSLLMVLVIGYMWLCSFAPSVCRAGIMFLIM